MSYKDCLAYIYSYTNYERKGLPKYTMDFYDLERIRTLLSRLGDPQRNFKSVLISGMQQPCQIP